MKGDVLTVIPARWASTRFPGKMLAPLRGKPVLQRVYEIAVRAKLGPVLIATDDVIVKKAAEAFGAEVVMTPAALPSGTDRVHRAAKGRREPIIINLQGDEPLMDPQSLRAVAKMLKKNPKAEMATAAAPLDPKEAGNPNIVKAVVAHDGRALYFSRSAIPHPAAHGGKAQYWAHMGLYGYRRSALDAFVKLKPSPLERTESLEQLRALEKGFTILVAPARARTVAIDTPGDLKAAEKVLKSRRGA